MPGTQDSGRPGGNPDLEQFQFEQKYDWSEPCTAQFNVRLPPSLYQELKKIEGYQELVRRAIADIVDEQRAIASEDGDFDPEDLII